MRLGNIIGLNLEVETLDFMSHQFTFIPSNVSDNKYVAITRHPYNRPSIEDSPHSMNGRELPGYYFDAEKNKYFKIQAHHKVPSGAKYSTSTVDHVRAAEQRDRKAVDDALERRQTLVKRSKVLQHAGIAGIGFSREIADDVLLRRRNLLGIRASAYGGRIFIDWERNWERLTGKDIVSSFAYDALSEDIMVGHDNEHSGHTLSTMSHSKRHVYHPVYAQPRSEVTSISISPARIALATTLGGTRPNPRNVGLPGAVPAEVHIMMLTSDEQEYAQTGNSRIRLTCDLRVSFFWHDETDIWSSAANPFIGSESSFAVGMSDKVVLYGNGDRGWSDNNERMQTQSDAFTVEWLQPQLLAIGQRDGIVKLWDTRSSGNAAAALALQHPGAISHIKSADSQRIVVHGRCTEDALCMYDLRYTTAMKPSKRKRDAIGVRQQRISQALLVYENEGNVRPVGFDISTDSGLVAAVDAKNKVQLYTLHNGHHVKSLESPGIVQGDGLPTRKLQFVTTRDGTEKLIGCTGGTMWSARS